MSHSEPMHFVDQSGQPPWSESRMCSQCGRMCWKGVEGSALRWTNERKAWDAAPDNCSKVLHPWGDR